MINGFRRTAELNSGVISVCKKANRLSTFCHYRVNDFLSDNIYARYSIGSPTVDPETGNIYWLSTAGLRPPSNEVGIELDHSRFDGPEDLRRSGLRHIADAAPFIRLAHGAER